MNPLRYINSWPAVVGFIAAVVGCVGIFALAGPDERVTVLTIATGLAALVSALARQAFAVPPASPPKRIEVPHDDDDDTDEGGEVLADDGPPTKPLRPTRISTLRREAQTMLIAGRMLWQS